MSDLTQIEGLQRENDVLKAQLAAAEREREVARSEVDVYLNCATYWWVKVHELRGLKAPEPQSSDRESDRKIKAMMDYMARAESAEREIAAAWKALEDFDAANKEDHTNKAVAAWRRLRAAIAPRAEGPAREASHAK